MIKKYLTCERYLEHYNKGEKTVVGRLDTSKHVCVTETDMSQENVFYDNLGMKIPRHVDYYLVGPIADTLHAYEELGYSPEELKEIIEENKKLKEITKKVGEEKFTLRYEHTTSPIGSVTTINLPDPKKDPITEVRNMAQMDQYFEDRNIKIDYIKQDIAIQKRIYDMLNPANRIGIEDLYPSTMICHRPSTPVIKDVIFNDPATIVFWKDGTKTVVKAQGEAFDPEKGLAMAFSKKMFGNDRDYYIQFLRWLKKAKKGAERKELNYADKSDS